MFKSLVVAASVLISVHASAAVNVFDVVTSLNKVVLGDSETMGLNWKVGDTGNYALNMGGFIKGTMVYSVKAINGAEATLSQDVDLGQFGKQNCETVIDTNNGQVKSVTCNGKPQDAGNADDIEVVDSKEDNISVPAGQFNCLYLKIHDKKQNTDMEQWANPKLVPVSGMVKAIAPSQLGKVVIELTSFKKM